MDFLRVGLGLLVFLVAAVVILNMEVGTETVVQAYYTHEPLRYEETFVKRGNDEEVAMGVAAASNRTTNPIRA